MKPICRSLAFSLATFLVVGTSSAKDTCGAEVKIQLQPSDVTKTISSLNLGGGQDGNVLFYDTDKLSLLRSGVILRIRNGGGDNDLTVKIRPPGDQPLSDPSHGEEDFKCEGDLNNGVIKPSYSVRIPFTKKSPNDGSALAENLSAAQRKLIEQAHVSIDWKQVHLIAKINSRTWEKKKSKDFPKLSIELWEWNPSRSLLELSSKTDEQTAQSTEERLKNLAAEHGLSLAPDARPKTSTVLESIVGEK